MLDAYVGQSIRDVKGAAKLNLSSRNAFDELTQCGKGCSRLQATYTKSQPLRPTKTANEKSVEDVEDDSASLSLLSPLVSQNPQMGRPIKGSKK